MAVGVSVLAQPDESSAPHVDLIVIDGSINPAVDDFIRESFTGAKSNGARALIIQLDTPGGLLSSTRTIVKEMLSAQVPIMVHVSSQRRRRWIGRGLYHHGGAHRRDGPGQPISARLIR